MTPNVQMFVQIMVFYIILSYVVFPAIFYFAFKKSLKQAGTGFVVGSVISILLWYMFGSKMIH